MARRVSHKKTVMLVFCGMAAGLGVNFDQLDGAGVVGDGVIA